MFVVVALLPSSSYNIIECILCAKNVFFLQKVFINPIIKCDSTQRSNLDADIWNCCLIFWHFNFFYFYFGVFKCRDKEMLCCDTMMIKQKIGMVKSDLQCCCLVSMLVVLRDLFVCVLERRRMQAIKNRQFWELVYCVLNGKQMQKCMKFIMNELRCWWKS